MIINKLLSAILIAHISLSSYFSLPSSKSFTGFMPWWFGGGDEIHVTSSQVENGISILMDGQDTVGADAWKYDDIRVPNCQSVSEASYITDSFSIEGNHEVIITFSMDCVTEDNKLNYLSGNGLNDIDVYVYDSSNDKQLASIRIWYDSGSYSNGDHSYALGILDGYPNACNGANWIVGDAKLSSYFTLAFSREYLFRSYVNKDMSKLVRLDSSNNHFYNSVHDAVESVDNIYFRFKGDNGWKKQANLLIRSINGQSLGGSGNVIEDVVPPEIIETSPMPSNIEVNQSFTLPIKAVDVLSHPALSFAVNGEDISGNVFKPLVQGNYTITATAEDAFGNKTSKDYNLTAIGIIEPPVITSLPVIENISVKENTTVTFDKPVYEDSEGNAVLKAFIKNNDDSSSSYTELNYNNETEKFTYTFTGNDKKGNYSIIYTIENSAGKVTSDPINFDVEVIIVPKPDYVNSQEGLTVSYVEEGILVNTIGGYRKIDFGAFNIRYGIDAYFTIPIYSSNGEKNTAAYFDMQFMSTKNENYWVMYRIWLNEEFLTNDSSPTNMYFNLGTPGNSQCKDVTDCGWLTRTVNGVDGRFHFHFDYSDGFSGEFRNALVSAKGTQEFTTRLLEGGGDEYTVLFYAASRGSGDDQNSEFIINELNGQNFENTDGVIDAVVRPVIEIGTINNVYAANSSFTTGIYVKDILCLNPAVHYRFTNEAGEVIKEETLADHTLNIDVPDPGFYKLKIFIINIKGREVGKTYDIESRSNLNPVTIDLDKTYESTYMPGEEIIVANPSYSSDVNLSKCKIILTRGNDVKEVSAGERIILEKAGTYILDYYACDNAYPTPNETHKKVYINVLDVVKPEVKVRISGSMRAEEMVTINIDVVDDTDCDIYAVITDVNGYKTIYQKDKLDLVFDQKGEYSLMVRVEDSYENTTIINQTFIIKTKAPNQVLVSWIVIGIFTLSLLGAFVALTVIDKKRNSRLEK